jgi:CheY-like chemotaxis protein
MHALAILVVTHGSARVADDREGRRKAPVVSQPVQSRQKFTLRQISCRAEDHYGAFGHTMLEAQRIRKRIPDLRHFCMVTSGLPASMESKKVLAVLEDLFFTVKINEAAKRAGLPITFVKSELDALEQAKTQPALIIMDINFQGIDPLSLIRKLKADDQTKRINLIGYLSHVQGELKMQAQEAGCDMVLPRSAFSQNLPQILKRHSSSS